MKRNKGTDEFLGVLRAKPFPQQGLDTGNNQPVEQFLICILRILQRYALSEKYREPAWRLLRQHTKFTTFTGSSRPRCKVRGGRRRQRHGAFGALMLRVGGVGRKCLSKTLQCLYKSCWKLHPADIDGRTTVLDWPALTEFKHPVGRRRTLFFSTWIFGTRSDMSRMGDRTAASAAAAVLAVENCAGAGGRALEIRSKRSLCCC